MRTTLASIAAAGVVAAAVGAFLSIDWMVLAGAAALIVASVMAALGAPRRER